MKKALFSEQDTVTPSPSPVPVNKAYFMLPDLRDMVILTIRELAPNGVGSQGEYRSLLSQALDEVDAKLNKNITSSSIMANIALTLNHIERELSEVPFESVL